MGSGLGLGFKSSAYKEHFVSVDELAQNCVAYGELHVGRVETCVTYNELLVQRVETL